MSNFTSLAGGSFTTNGSFDANFNFVGSQFDFTPTNSGGLAKDSLGNIYIADTANHTIRRITDLRTTITFAGTAGQSGSTDGTGAAARFNNPKGLATDSSNNLFVSDTGNGVIRKITSAGVVTTHPGSSGTGLATDSSDNLYIAVTSLHIIQKVTSAGVVTTLAGLSGSSGNTDGTGSAARFNSPTGIATDSSGNIYVTESSTTIRKITPAGVVTTLAGTAGQIDSVDGLGADARFVQPIGITVDSNDNIFVSDFGSNRPGGQIRRITPAGFVTSIAGARGSIGGPAISSVDGRGTAGTFGDISARLGLLAIDSNKLFFSQGPTTAQPGSYLRYVRPESNLILSPFVGTSGSGGSADAIGPNARFSQPNQTAFDANGNTYVADYANYTIRKITPAGVVTTLAGTAGQSGSTDGTGAAARFNAPVNMTVGQTYFSSGVAVNDLYVTSGGNFRKITYAGVVTTPSGAGALAGAPWGIAINKETGDTYVSLNIANIIQKITSAGVVTTLAGTSGSPGSTDGTGSAARFKTPKGISIDDFGNIYVADSGNFTIRKITSAGVVTTLFGVASVSAPLSKAGVNSVARLAASTHVSVDSTGSIYLSEDSSIKRTLLSFGFLAGSTTSSGSADGTGPNARFQSLAVGAFDSAGNLYVSDSGNYTIRKITPAGVVTKLTGVTGEPGSSDGSNTPARFSYPSNLAVDTTNNIYVADTNNSTIRKITSAGVVTTLAGTAGAAGSTDGTGSAARFLYPQSIAADTAGNVFVADTENHTIRKITSAGVVTTFAGTAGVPGSADGTGSAARFASPRGVAVDSAGNVFVGDSSNNMIRKITSAGVVTTFAGLASPGGGGSPGGSTDGTGSAARFFIPTGVYIDSADNIYVADENNSIIRKITSAAVVTTLAGTALSTGAADGTGSAARFYNPRGVAVDSAGNVFVGDTINQTIRKITSAGVVTTLAGSPGSPGSADGTGTVGRFGLVTGLVMAPDGNLYASDQNNYIIRKITLAGVVTTLAGIAGQSGSTDGTGTGVAPKFNLPQGVTVDASGNIFVVDKINQTIRKITSAGVTTTFAGTLGVSGSTDGTGTAAKFNFSITSGITVDASGNLFVADDGNYTIRKITSAGVVTTFAGTAGVQGGTDGTGSAARFSVPAGVAVDSAGNVFVADNQMIRKITSAGVVTTLAGQFASSGSADGTGSAARFNNARDIAIDTSGDLYVADLSNYTIRKVTSAGVVTTLAGTAGAFGSTDGTGSAARFNSPTGVAVDSAGNVFVADTTNNTIRKITSAGVVTTFAGLAGAPTGINDGTGSAARFYGPQRLAFDSTGNLFVADTNQFSIRKITSAALVTTFAGTPLYPGSADGTGAAARFDGIIRLAVDSSGNLYTPSYNRHTIRKITPAGVVTTLAGTDGVSGYVDGTGSAARFNQPQTITADSAGNLYVYDELNLVVRKITSAGVVTTFVGTQPLPGQRDATGANARLLGFGQGLTTDAADNIYGSSAATRLISPSAEVSTIVGNQFAFASLTPTANFTGYEPATGTAFRTVVNGPNGTMAVLGPNFISTSAGNTLLPQTITFAALPSVAANSGSFVVSPTASSGLTVTLTSSNPAVASVNGFTITPLTAGSVTITATQAGDGSVYAAATPVPQPFTVTLAPQTITFAALPTTAITSGPFVVSPTASSGLTVTLTSSNPAVASVNGFTITPLSIGSASITATQAGNGTFAAATPVPQPITIVSTPQTITFAVLPPVTITSGPFVVSPTASSGLTVTLTSSNPAVASVNGFTITPLSIGSASITATQAGNGTFAAATPVPQPLSVSLVPQTISFGSLASVLPSAPPFVVSPSASSGLIVTLTSSNPAVASVSGFTITPLAVGSTTITATQAGNGTFAAASPVPQPLSVSNPAACNDVAGCDCECDTLVIGEAGPQGPQGLLGINGTNGSNGLNAFTTLSASFVQPNEAPAAGNTATILVGNSAWIALGQNIYISQAGYYQVTGIVSSTSIAVSLLSYEILSPGSTVPSGRKISPSSQAVYIDPVVTSLDINQGSSAINPVLRARGSNTLPLLQVDAILNKVGINVSPVAGGKTLTVGGSLEVTGDSTTVSGFVSAARLRVGSSSPAAELDKLLFFSQNVSVTLSGSVGAAQRVSVTCTGAALGDIVSVGYTADPVGTFENDVSVSAVVSAANTVNVFFQNYSTTSYSGATIGLKIIVSTYIAAT